MKRLFMLAVAILLLMIALPSQAQTDHQFITGDWSDGIMTQSSPDAEPQSLNVGHPGEIYYLPVLSPDQRYLAQAVMAGEYLNLPEAEQTAIHSVPENIVVIDLQTGESKWIARQSENFPDDPWIYRSIPTWSPTANQFAFSEYTHETGAIVRIYDADTDTLTDLAEAIPTGYSDAGAIGLPYVEWAEVGIYSLESNAASDGFGFVQTLTILDPTGQTPAQSWVVGRTARGGGYSVDTVLDVVEGLSPLGQPALLMADWLGDWFILPETGFGRIDISTPALRPAGGGDIDIRFARTSELDPDTRWGFPHYRAYIRHGDDAFEPLNLLVSSLYRLDSSVQLFPAPDGSSVIFKSGSQYIQWFGPDDSRDIDLDDRMILDWGDWEFVAETDCHYESIVAVRDDSVQTIRMKRNEAIPLYAAPGERADIIGEVQPDELVRLVTGPLCFDRTNWYEIVVGEDDVYGWVQGEVAGAVWLEDFH